MLTIENYLYKSWAEKYNQDNYEVKLQELKIHNSWIEFFSREYEQEHFIRINKYLSHCLKITDGKVKIYPYPDLLFNAFNLTPFNKIKVVILGQDPYHQNEKHDKLIPQAMGLAFSVPVGIKIPSSLMNIFKNLLKFNIIKEFPNHGNLERWAKQGVLLLNTTLTVQHGHPNGHLKYWENFTNNMIKYISDNSENIVFVLWGRPALDKLKFINSKKHKILISSHPSGLSCHQKLKNYPAFMDMNHFGEINEYLKSNNIKKINWQLKIV